MLESGNPFDKASIPTEARQQQIVGVPGEHLPDHQSKVLLALDGTEAGDKAFDYLLNNKTIAQGSHIFLTTVLPANVLGGPWVSGPLSIDTKKQNELLRQLRQQAVERMSPYKNKLKERGFNVTMHVLHGDARASLLKVITYHKVDLVLMYVFGCAISQKLTQQQRQAQPWLEAWPDQWYRLFVSGEPLACPRPGDQVIVNRPSLALPTYCRN